MYRCTTCGAGISPNANICYNCGETCHDNGCCIIVVIIIILMAAIGVGK